MFLLCMQLDECRPGGVPQTLKLCLRQTCQTLREKERRHRERPEEHADENVIAQKRRLPAEGYRQRGPTEGPERLTVPGLHRDGS